MSRKAVVAVLLVVTVVATTMAFISSHRYDQIYLNPYYVDVLALGAGCFLVADAFRSVLSDRFLSVLLRAATGAAVVTIHILQAAFDLLRR